MYRVVNPKRKVNQECSLYDYAVCDTVFPVCGVILRMHFCFVVLVLVFQYLAKRLAVKNVSEMTYFVLDWT